MNYRNSIHRTIDADLGFTLVELLVGLFLSIFIIGIALTYFVSSSQTFRVQTNESIVQENARFALEILAQNLRLAGLNPSNEVTLSEGLGTGFDALSSFCTDNEDGLADNANGTTRCTLDELANGSDRVAVTYIAEAELGPVNISGCNNQSISIAQGGHARLANVLWSAANQNGIRSLFCQTFDLNANQAVGVALPLVDGIDAMQFQYGVDFDDDGQIDRYQSITNVADPATIRTVRVALLISSGLTKVVDATTEVQRNRTFNLLDGPPINFNDGQIRQLFTTTILIPNTI